MGGERDLGAANVILSRSSVIRRVRIKKESLLFGILLLPFVCARDMHNID